jgi:hypothetical protein
MIDKNSDNYKQGFIDGQEKGSGSAKHYMNYILCETVCRELKQLGGVAPDFKIENLYKEYQEKGDKIAEQLNLEPIWGLYESECCGAGSGSGFCTSCGEHV